MNILLQKVSRVGEPSQAIDMRIVDGKIAEIGQGLATGDSQSIDLQGLQITEGWLELFSDFSDPGFEYREDLQSGAATAASGGFTDVCVLPNTSPVVDSKADIEYVKSRAASLPVTLHPVGALSMEAKGERIAELYDLWHAGAVFFSDGTAPVWNSELLLKALQYTQRFDGLVVTTPVDKGLSQFGQMHEGPVSTSLGLKGIPSIAEVISLRRDLEILKYAGGRMHVSGLSTAQSVELIRDARQEGLRVTCDVPLYNLLYVDADMPPFDTTYKVAPPLRTGEDREALIRGLKDDTIDAISCRHFPRDKEEKDLEFDLAEFGAISLQTAFNGLEMLSKDIDMQVLLKKLSEGPRQVLGMDPVSLEVGSVAKITIIDAEVQWTYDLASNRSKSANSPLLGKELKGRSVGIINGDKVFLPEHL